MEMPSIKVDRIQVRLRDISPRLVRASVKGMGNELLKQLAGRQFSLKEKSGGRISRIDSGTLQAERDTTSTDLRRMIGKRIIESIASKTKSEAGKRG